jgi:hypothetical protein
VRREIRLVAPHDDPVDDTQGTARRADAAHERGGVMIVGCYVLDLYCQEGRGPDGVAPGGTCRTPVGQFTGDDRAMARRKAHRRGWTFTRAGDVLCPNCANRSSRRPKAKGAP